MSHDSARFWVEEPENTFSIKVWHAFVSNSYFQSKSHISSPKNKFHWDSQFYRQIFKFLSTHIVRLIIESSGRWFAALFIPSFSVKYTSSSQSLTSAFRSLTSTFVSNGRSDGRSDGRAVGNVFFIPYEITNRRQNHQIRIERKKLCRQALISSSRV